MKVPTLDDPRDTRPVSTSYSNLDQRTGLDSLAKGLEQAGAGIGQAVAARDLAAKKAKAKADAIGATETLAAFQGVITSAMEGDAEAEAMGPGSERAMGTGANFDDKASRPRAFLRTSGKDAFAASAPTLEYLDKQRRQLAQALPNDEQRAMFEEHAQRLSTSTRSRVEQHTGGQLRVAADDALKVAKLRALRALPSDPREILAVAQAAEDVAKQIRAVRGEGAGEEEVLQWKEQVAAAAMEKYMDLAPTDWQSAKTALDRLSPMLGSRERTYYGEKIRKYETDSRMEDGAKQAVVIATVNGKVDPQVAEDVADEIASRLGLSEADRKDLMARTSARAGRETRRLEAANKAVSREVYQKVNALTWELTPTVDKDRLNAADPQLWDQLEARSRAEARQRKQSWEQNVREQRLADQLAMQAYQKIEGAANRARLNVAESPLFVWASPEGRGAIEVLQRKDKEMVKKGEAVPISVAADDFMSRVPAEAFVDGKPPKGEAARRAQMRTEFEHAYYDAASDKKAPLNAGEVAQIKATIYLRYAGTGAKNRAHYSDVASMAADVAVKYAEENRLPEENTPAEAAKARARQLKAQGLSNAEIARRISEEFPTEAP